MSESVEALCDRVVELRAKRAELKKEVEGLEGELGSLESQIAERLLGEESGPVSVSGFVFQGSRKISWKTIAQQRDALIVALKEGAPELVKETVNSSTLSSYLRKNADTLESDNPSWWASAKNCLSRTESASLSVRKKAKKSSK